METARTLLAQLQPVINETAKRLDDWEKDHPEPAPNSFFHNGWAKKYDALLTDDEWDKHGLYRKAREKFAEYQKTKRRKLLNKKFGLSVLMMWT